jgi:hypothetical protein
MMVRNSLLALGLLGAVSFPAVSAELLVIESNEPAVAVGTLLPGGATVKVADKRRVVLVDPAGKTVTLNGPFDGAPPQVEAKGDGRLLTALASLVRRKGEETGSVGAVRAIDAGWRSEWAKDLKDVLTIDPTSGGNACVYDAGKAELVRNPLNPVAPALVLDSETGETAPLEWKQGLDRLSWPSAVPVADGRSYVFEQPGKPTATILTLRVLRARGGASDIERVAQLAEAGCDEQARLLLRVIGKSAS